jgi:hypothetical protein
MQKNSLDEKKIMQIHNFWTFLDHSKSQNYANFY